MTTLDSFAILLCSGKYTTDIALKKVTNAFKLKLLDLHIFKFTSIVIFAPYIRRGGNCCSQYGTGQRSVNYGLQYFYCIITSDSNDLSQQQAVSLVLSSDVFHWGFYHMYMYKRSARIDHYTTCKSIIFIKKADYFVFYFPKSIF